LPLEFVFPLNGQKTASATLQLSAADTCSHLRETKTLSAEGLFSSIFKCDGNVFDACVAFGKPEQNTTDSKPYRRSLTARVEYLQ
jgi:hypothetical protein